MMNFFSFLQERGGKSSGTRLMAFIILCCGMTDYMHAVFTVGIWHPDIQTIGMIVSPIVAAVAHSFGEQYPDDNKTGASK